ncbi:MAG TPA: PAS domain S-box protein [Gammaproteobacteria bacterium]
MSSPGKLVTAETFPAEWEHVAAPLLRYDKAGHLRFASAAAATSLGFPDVFTLCSKASRLEALFPDGSVAEVQRETADGSLFSACWNVHSPSGTAIEISVLFLPEPQGWVCLLPGATELLKLREDESRFHVLMDALLSGVFLTDGERFRFVNRGFASMLGFEPEELIGASCTRQFAPETRQWLDQFTELDIAANPDRIHQASLVTKDGVGQREVLVRFHCMRYFGEALFIGSTYDITDIRHSERALQDYARRLRLVSQQVLQVQESERRSLARELHDEIGQQLTLVKLSLAQLATGPEPSPLINEALSAVSTLMQQVRDLSLDLRPSMLDDLGLGATLRWYAGRIARLAALDTRVDVDPEFPRLDHEVETLFFRVAQEAITNVMRHAHARTLDLRLVSNGDHIELIVSDDGCGFDAGPTREAAMRGKSAGLLGMQERAALGGAELVIDSNRGSGTVLRLFMSGKRAGIRSNPA